MVGGLARPAISMPGHSSSGSAQGRLTIADASVVIGGSRVPPQEFLILHREVETTLSGGERFDLRGMMAAVVRVALADLAERHGRPEFDIQFDPSSWKRHGQESFAVNREVMWRRPSETYSQ
jgi:hypothetical protein